MRLTNGRGGLGRIRPFRQKKGERTGHWSILRQRVIFSSRRRHTRFNEATLDQRSGTLPELKRFLTHSTSSIGFAQRRCPQLHLRRWLVRSHTCMYVLNATWNDLKAILPRSRTLPFARG